MKENTAAATTMIRISREHHKLLKILSAGRGVSLQEVLEGIIDKSFKGEMQDLLGEEFMDVFKIQ